MLEGGPAGTLGGRAAKREMGLAKAPMFCIRFAALLGLVLLLLEVGLGVGVTGAEAAAQRKVIRLEAIKVEGRIQKPQAFYILQRSNLNFEGLDLKQSFIPKIIKSVEEQPF